MSFKQQYTMPVGSTLTCPDCQETQFLYSGSKVTCKSCGWKHGTTNKYGAKKTEYNGKKYDSKFEAGVAQELDLRLKGKDILEVIPQYKVEIPVHCPDGTLAFTVYHKVDFRIKHRDGSYELCEAKGVETDDYKWRRKLLENIFLPMHKDYTYLVIKQKSGFRK